MLLPVFVLLGFLFWFGFGFFFEGWGYCFVLIFFFFFVLVWFFGGQGIETGFLCVALAVLELAL